MKIRVYPQHGFSVIECMVYFVLITFLIMLLLGWIVQLQVRLKKNQDQIVQLTAVYVAHDLFRNDVLSAVPDKESWKKISDTELIWHAHDMDIGWLYEQGKLFRYQGTYHAHGTWNNLIKSVVADSLGSVRYAMIMHNTTIVGVKMVSDTVSTVVALNVRGKRNA
jgi:type II secretory pathway pseudopilin PulG